MTVAICNPSDLGTAIRRARRAHGLRLEDVALAAGTGIRFVSELERGKPTVQIDKALYVLHALGLRLDLGGPGLNDT